MRRPSLETLRAGAARFRRAARTFGQAVRQVACTVTLSHDPERLAPGDTTWWRRCRRCGLVYME